MITNPKWGLAREFFENFLQQLSYNSPLSQALYLMIAVLSRKQAILRPALIPIRRTVRGRRLRRG
jgi:hypothetical protein